MKTIKNIALIAIVILLGLTSCKKTNDFGGSATIKGNVTLKGVSVSKAVVYLTFNATAASSTHNATTITDESGNFTFGGLLRGDYFVTAEYTNASGQTFTSGGGHATIGDKKGTVTADLTVQ
jgi:hypothetical protein